MTKYGFVISKGLNEKLNSIGDDRERIVLDDLELVDSQAMTIEQVGKVRLIMSNEWAKGYTEGEETIDLDESEYEILDE